MDLELKEQLAAEKVKARAKCRSNIFFLAQQLGYDFQWETHAELFANFLKFKEDVAWADLSEIKDVMILWSRGHYKTTAVVVAIIQAILNNPNVRILIMQGSIGVTQTLLKQIMAHFMGEAENSKLIELFPEFCGNKQALKGNVKQFTTCARTHKQLAQATVTVASPRSVKTGQHYDMGFFDDLVNDQNFRNSKLLGKVKEDFTMAQPLIDPGGYRVVTGTRYAFGDLYEDILRWQNASGKWLISIKDCWTDDSKGLPDVQKQPRFPRFTKQNGQLGGFTTEELLQIQTDEPAHFACQYLNKPIHTSLQYFTEVGLEAAQIAYADTPALSQCIMAIDLANSDNIKADDSVIQIGRTDVFGIGYLCDQEGGQWEPIDTALHVIGIYLKYRPTKVFLEKSSAGVMFKNILEMVARQKRIYNLPLEFIAVDNRENAKNMRVQLLAGVVKRGKFKFLKGLPKWDRLVEQAIQFPKGKYGHDDYIDTAALLYQKLTEEALQHPVHLPVTNPILAMLQSQSDPLVRELTSDERQALNQDDLTGFE